MRTKDHSECAVTIGANVLQPNILFKDLFAIIRPSSFTLVKSCNWACFQNLQLFTISAGNIS